MDRPKTIAIAAVTLDGKIAKNDHELVRWTSREDKEMFRRETARIGVMILGNKTYATFPVPLPKRLHIVMTKSLEGKQPIPGQVEFTSQSPEDILADLCKRGFLSVVIAGGSSIYSIFLKKHLLDEIWLTIEPKIFGEGISMFRNTGEFDGDVISHELLNPNSLLLKVKVRYH